MKNKKTYFPFGLDIILYLVFSIISLGVLIFIVVKFNDPLRISIISFLFIFATYYFLKTLILYRIKFNDKEISMIKDYGIFKEDRVQDKITINLEEVVEFKVILSDSNSSGVKQKSAGKKNKFIEFSMKDESKKRIFVSNMNKKQLLNIVNRIENITNLELITK